MPIDNLDIYRLAKMLLERHGDRAAANASGRAEHFSLQGDPEGEAIWRWGVAAIEELQRMEPDGAVH